jgi:hypothetical protein
MLAVVRGAVLCARSVRWVQPYLLPLFPQRSPEKMCPPCFLPISFAFRFAVSAFTTRCGHFASFAPSTPPGKLEKLARWQEYELVGDGLQKTFCCLTITEKSWDQSL